MLPLAVILLCALILFQDAIRRGWIYYEFDTSVYYFPVTRWLDKAISHGTFPLWSPDVYGGFPLFADGETGALYPPTVALLALLEPAQAFVAAAVLHYFLAGAFAYAFLRVLRQQRLPALITGLTFSFGSFMVAQMHHVNVVQSATWLPLILLFVEMALRVACWRRAVCTVLGASAFAMQLLTIHVQPVLISLVLLAAWIAFRVLWSGCPGIVQRLGAGLAIGFGTVTLGLALAAVQLVPLAELVTQAARGNDQGYAFGSSFAAPLPSLLTVLFPFFFRHHGYDYWTLWYRWEITLYVGIVPLAFALIAVALRRSREVIFLAALAIIATLLMLGDYSPIKLYWLWWQVPGLSGLRAPGRFSLLTVFSLAVLAGLGAQTIQTRFTERKGRAPVRIVASIAMAGALLFVGVTLTGRWIATNKTAALELISSSYLSLRRQPGINLSESQIYDSLRGTLDWHNGRTDLPILILFALSAILAGWMLFKRARAVWQASLVVLVGFDLLAFAVIYHPQTHVSSMEAASTVANFLANSKGLHRVYTQQVFGSTTLNRMLPLGVASVSGYSSLEGQRYRAYSRLVRQGSPSLLDLWNVRYVVALNGSPLSPPEKYRRVFEDGDSAVFENTGYLPRAFVVANGVVAESPAAALGLVSQPGFDPRATVIIETSRPQKINREPRNTTDKLAARAQVIQYEDSEVRVEAEADRDSYLVLSDVYYPGWAASIDGQSTELYQADYLFRAVRLPAGRHVVEFRYDPLTIKLGAIISAMAAAGVIAVVTAAYVISKRQQGIAT